MRNKPQIGFRIKNFQERHIPLTDAALEVLIDLKRKQQPNSDFVFHKPDGSKWESVHVSFNGAVKASGIKSEYPERVTIHTLRHTFGSHLVMMGVPMRVIQQLMGHRNLTTTERYAHLSPETLTDVVRKLDFGSRLVRKSIRNTSLVEA